jgi:hypothetical protein
VLSTSDAKHLLTTVAPGPPKHPQSLVGPTPQSPSVPNDHWYWNGDGIVDGGKLRVLEFEQQPTDDPPPFNFAWTRTKLATLDARTFRLEKLTDVPSAGGVQWGTELVRDGACSSVPADTVAGSGLHGSGAAPTTRRSTRSSRSRLPGRIG